MNQNSKYNHYDHNNNNNNFENDLNNFDRNNLNHYDWSHQIRLINAQKMKSVKDLVYCDLNQLKDIILLTYNSNPFLVGSEEKSLYTQLASVADDSFANILQSFLFLICFCCRNLVFLYTFYICFFLIRVFIKIKVKIWNLWLFETDIERIREWYAYSFYFFRVLILQYIAWCIYIDQYYIIYV